MNIDEAVEKLAAFKLLREDRTFCGLTTPIAALASHCYSGGWHFFGIGHDLYYVHVRTKGVGCSMRDDVDEGAA